MTELTPPQPPPNIAEVRLFFTGLGQACQQAAEAEDPRALMLGLILIEGAPRQLRKLMGVRP